MRFQPGQSGNPAGRPPGARNKKTELAEDVLAVAAQETAIKIVARAHCGDKAAMRLVMERTVPTGTDRPLELKLPTVEGPEDLIAAAGVVLQALAAGDISSRETVCMLTVVERLGRIADRAQQMKERRADRRDAPPAAAGRTNEGGLYSLVNSQNSQTTPGCEPLYSPVNSETTPPAEPLYSPVNSGHEGAEKEQSVSAAPGQNGGEGLYFPVNSANDATKKEAAGSVATEKTEGKSLYSPVNSIENAVAGPHSASAPDSLLKRRRRELMSGASPAALLTGERPVDPRSFVTDQTWLGALRETGLPGARSRNAA
jgi:Family of unknown function (DUF5681)